MKIKVKAAQLNSKFAARGLGVEHALAEADDCMYRDLDIEVHETTSSSTVARVIPRAWTPMHLHPKQRGYYRSTARFNVAPAGRRTGKTEIAVRRCIERATGPQRFPDAWYILGAPTYGQAKRVFWRRLNRLLPPCCVWGRPNLSELTVRLVNGAEVSVIGLDQPARVEGRPIDGGVLDEYGNMKKETWTQHIRAALTDRQGWLDFTGVPEGRNHYHQLTLEAEELDDWAVHHWTTEDVLPLYLGVENAAREIAAAKRELDELSYAQEYLASFVTFKGLAYYGFGPENVVAGLHGKYNSSAPLILMFDFNVEPGVAVIGQEYSDGTGIIDEVYIPKNSNTVMVCKEIVRKYAAHRGDVLLYGDATGGARGSAKVNGSDWDLIRAALRPTFEGRLKFRVPKANPSERARINALNSRIKAGDGTRKLLVDKERASHVVTDLESVQTKPDGSIDKSIGHLTHPSDALGYYVIRRWPIVNTSRFTSEEVAA
jgi:hypothetical protein